MARWLADLRYKYVGRCEDSVSDLATQTDARPLKQIVWDAWSRRLADAAVTIGMK